MNCALPPTGMRLQRVPPLPILRWVNRWSAIDRCMRMRGVYYTCRVSSARGWILNDEPDKPGVSSLTVCFRNIYRQLESSRAPPTCANDVGYMKCQTHHPERTHPQQTGRLTTRYEISHLYQGSFDGCYLSEEKDAGEEQGGAHAVQRRPPDTAAARCPQNECDQQHGETEQVKKVPYVTVVQVGPLVVQLLTLPRDGGLF